MEEILAQILDKLESLEQDISIVKSDINDLREDQRATHTIDRIEAKIDVLQLEAIHLRRKQSSHY